MTLRRAGIYSSSGLGRSKSMWSLSSDEKRNSFINPDKAKITQLLKTTQLEQLSKLQHKNQLECDLVDDIRNFGKQRAQLEKDYAQSLQKLVAQYQKKDLSTATFSDEDGPRTVAEAWKSVLDATDKAAHARFEASENYKNNIYEAAKNCKTQKDIQLKKCQDLLNSLQNEIAETVKDLMKSKKKYFEQQQISASAKEKYQEVNERLKKNATSIFKSKSGLEKTLQKLEQRCDESKKLATLSRNDYLLMLAVSNAHQKRYYEIDMPEAIRVLDGDIHSRLQGYLSALNKYEVDTCIKTQDAFTKSLQAADQISREHSTRCFLHENPVFEWGPRYEFEVCGSDPVGENLSSEQPGEDNSLNREARKWSARLVRDETQMKRCEKIKQGFENRCLKFAENPATPETIKLETTVRLEKNKQDLRKAETSRLRCLARLDLLRNADINVDTWIESATAQAAKELSESLANTPAPAKPSHNSSSVDTPFEGSFFEEDFIEDDTFNDDSAFGSDKDNLSIPSSDRSRKYPITCTVSYAYKATREDELTIRVGDKIEVVEDGDLDQWVRARDGSGKLGYVPENYLDFPESSSSPHHQYALPPGDTDTLRSLSTESSTSSDNSITTNSLVSQNDREVGSITSEAALEQRSAPPAGALCLGRAMYEYEAAADEELSFPEGAIINILSKNDNGVDDGWWKGELNGRVGVFPGIVVEELADNGGIPSLNESPVDSPTPPTFCPPPPFPPSISVDHTPQQPGEVISVRDGRANSAPPSPIYLQGKKKMHRSAPAPPQRPTSFLHQNNFAR